MSERKKLGLAMMMAMMDSGFPKSHNHPNPDKSIINPPQSEESKQFYIKRAEERRLRKNKKRKQGR